MGLAVLVGFGFLAARPHTVVALDRRARVRRGRLPADLARDLDDLAASGLRGVVTLRGRGDTLRVETRGLSEGDAQRVRNVVMLRRQRLR